MKKLPKKLVVQFIEFVGKQDPDNNYNPDFTDTCPLGMFFQNLGKTRVIVGLNHLQYAEFGDLNVIRYRIPKWVNRTIFVRKKYMAFGNPAPKKRCTFGKLLDRLHKLRPV